MSFTLVLTQHGVPPVDEGRVLKASLVWLLAHVLVVISVAVYNDALGGDHLLVQVQLRIEIDRQARLWLRFQASEDCRKDFSYLYGMALDRYAVVGLLPVPVVVRNVLRKKDSLLEIVAEVGRSCPSPSDGRQGSCASEISLITI